MSAESHPPAGSNSALSPHHSALRMYTLGHSTRSLEELLALLREHGIKRLVDIRRYPGSRRHPHFSREALERSMPEHDVEYVHMPELGGRRKPRGDSPNMALRNEQFRAYADYMATREFAEAIDRLLRVPRSSSGSLGSSALSEGLRGTQEPTNSPARTAIMCAEAVPWRCHRNLVSDDLVRRGVEVVHIIGRNSAKRHEMTADARVEGDHVAYPAPQAALRL
jgi:uncharacterized protein (DUF488 family)